MLGAEGSRDAMVEAPLRKHRYRYEKENPAMHLDEPLEALLSRARSKVSNLTAEAMSSSGSEDAAEHAAQDSAPVLQAAQQVAQRGVRPGAGRWLSSIPEAASSAQPEGEQSIQHQGNHNRLPSVSALTQPTAQPTQPNSQLADIATPASPHFNVELSELSLAASGSISVEGGRRDSPVAIDLGQSPFWHLNHAALESGLSSGLDASTSALNNGDVELPES